MTDAFADWERNRRVDREIERVAGMAAAPSGYLLVYQGGHHNIYCNGVEHLRSNGGFTGLTRRQAGRLTFEPHVFACDCARYH